MGERYKLAATVGRAMTAIARAQLGALALAALVASAGPAGGQAPTPSPDTRPSLLPSWAWPAGPAIAKHAMIAAAHPLAVEAGLEILSAGGSAADAAIGVQLVLNLVEPQSSGIGGGAFALYWDAAKEQLKSYDGRETAPASARPDRFLVGKSPMALGAAIFGGASVGVPGTVRLLETLHKQHGRLPWARLFEPAIRLAEQGFPVSPRLHVLLRWYGPQSFAPRARDYFFDRGGSARPAGYVLKSPELAATLRAIAERGAAAFYEGAIAQAIVAAVHDAPNHQGDVTLADLAGYRVKEREPLCFEYRQQPHLRHGSAVVGRPGGRPDPEVGRALRPGRGTGGCPEPAGTAPDRRGSDASPSPIATATWATPISSPCRRRCSMRLSRRAARSDRPRGRHGQAERRHSAQDRQPGAWRGRHRGAGRHQPSLHRRPRRQHRLSMTSTIESGFGSRMWAAGFLLNNELTDFALSPVDRAGRPLANAVGPGKRPRSSMAPTIVFDEEGKPWAVLGSPGGSRIILYVVKTLVALIDWKLDAQAAASLMNFGSRGGAFEIEVDHRSALWHALKMKPYGHRIATDYLASGAHVIVRRPDKRLEGGADPRREGVALGE